MGNASDSQLLGWKAALLIGLFMLQASSAISPCAGSTDRLVKSSVFCVRAAGFQAGGVDRRWDTHWRADEPRLAESAVLPGVLALP